MVNLYQKQGMSREYGIRLWEGVGCQAAWDVVLLDERTKISEKLCFPLLTPYLYSVHRPHMLPGFENKQDCTNQIGKFCLLVSPRKRNVLIPSCHHLCSLIYYSEYILHLFPEKEITVLQILTSSVTCICAFLICKGGSSYSLKELSQRRFWPLWKRQLVVPAEAFAVHAMARLDLGKNSIRYLTQKQIGRGKEGRTGCLFWGIIY